MKRKILFFIPSMAIGGAERVFSVLVRGLDRDRFEPVLALTKGGGAFLADIPADVPVIEMGLASHALAAPRMLSLIRRLGPDTVLATHSHLNTLLGTLRPFVPRRTRLIGRETALLRYHHATTGHARLLDFLTRRFYPGLDAVVCQSTDMRRELIERYGLSPDKLRPLPNPVDVDAVFQGSQEKPDMPLPPAPFFLAAGRLSPEKDFALLVTAFARLENRRVHLLLLGEGPLRERLTELAGRLGVAGRVHLPGATRRPFPAMARAAAYVLSSAYDSFPNVLLEAGACGTPVVAGRCPGAAREIVEEGVTGLTAPPGDADALASAMNRALSTSFDREAIRRRTRERFDIGVVIPAYEKVLEEA